MLEDGSIDEVESRGRDRNNTYPDPISVKCGVEGPISLSKR